jgi:hypothetical protein
MFGAASSKERGADDARDRRLIPVDTDTHEVIARRASC